jgi:putative endonuclease
MKLGERGEKIAVDFLQKQGYRIIKKNYRTRLGEIDLIARDGDTLVFIEVKTRESLEYGNPYESVNNLKKRKIGNVALLYLKGLKKIPPCRFDVVSISYEDGKPELNLIKDAFEL